MEGMNRDDLEFGLKVIGLDYTSRELIETLIKLDDARDLSEATKLAEIAFDMLKDNVIERYSAIVRSMKSERVVEAREERVKVQGGL